MTQAVQVTGAVCEHGEGPVWSAAWPGLRGRGAPVPAGRAAGRPGRAPGQPGHRLYFRRPRLDQLYITTSRLGLPRSAEAAAGALFRADVGVTGLPAATFAG